MINKIMTLSIVCLLSIENSNAMKSLLISKDSVTLSEEKIRQAILDKYARHGQVKICERTEENAYDIFIDTLEDHIFSKGRYVHNFILNNDDYSKRYYRIDSGVCDISDGILAIRGDVFRNNKKFNHVRLPKYLLGIDTNAFAGTNITEIEIPDSVVAIAPYAFFCCIKLTKVSISRKTIVMHNAFTASRKVIISYRD